MDICNEPFSENISSKPILFQVLSIDYEPGHNDYFFVEGVSTDETFDGVSAMVEFENFFYLERRTPFQNKTEAEDFLADVQNHLDSLESVVPHNPYGALDGWMASKPKNLHPNFWEKSTVSENLSDFCNRFELIADRYKTFAHYMPPEYFLNVLKIYVRKPYMTQSLHDYFESAEYETFLKRKNQHPNHLVRTFMATCPPALMFSLETKISQGKWYEISDYRLLSPKDSATFRKTNLVAKYEDFRLDEKMIDPAPIKIFSFDIETVTVIVDPNNNRSFCRPVVSDQDLKKGDLIEDADPITVIVASVFRLVDGQLELLDAKGFVFKHPDAEPAVSVAEWILRCKEKIESVGGSFENFSGKFWGYDKFSILEYSTEMEMIYAFEEYLHASDPEILTGWNVDAFDLPYIFKRAQHNKNMHLFELDPQFRNKAGYEFRMPNFGRLKFDVSRLKTFFYRKEEKKTASSKGKKQYDFVTIPHYVLNDGCLIWKDDYKKEKPYSLGNISQNRLIYPTEVIVQTIDTLCKKHPVEKNWNSRVEPSMKRILSENALEEEKKVLHFGTMAEMNYLKSVYSGLPISYFENDSAGLDRFEHLEKKVPKQFPMKKIEFHHSYRNRYWKAGGTYMTKDALYCFGDTVLPAKLLEKVGKFLSQISFCAVVGLNLDHVLNRGQQMKVSTALYRAANTFSGGIYLLHDKGNHHYHWPGIFFHRVSPHRGVTEQWDRLKPYVPQKVGGKTVPANEGGCVQKPYKYGILLGYLFTLDFQALYPNIINTCGLCLKNFVNQPLIDQYGLKRCEIFEKVLGDSKKNTAGECIRSKKESLAVGCESENLKIARFHQSPGMIPAVMVEYSKARGNAKLAKSAWLKLGNLLNEISSTVSKETGVVAGNLPLSEIVSKKLGDCATDLDRFEKNLRIVLANSEVRGDRLFCDTISEFLENLQLVYFLNKNFSWCYAIAKDSEEFFKAYKCELLKQVVHKICGIPEPSRICSEIIRICKFQTNYYDHFQLNVKCNSNSIYGVVMRMQGPFSLPELGATVTAFGRMLITQTKCTAERQTSSNNKRRAGFYEGREEVLDLPKSKPVGVASGKKLHPCGRAVRLLKNDFCKENVNRLKSNESLQVTYGDTDSIMVLNPRHNVVTKQEAFKTMKFLADLINRDYVKTLKLEDEKISSSTLIYKMKTYDMMAYENTDPDKIKWLFSGAEKSDILGFVNDLLRRCKEFLLTAISEHKPLNESISYVVYLVKKKLLEFSTGKIPLYNLTVTQKLSSYDPEKVSTQLQKIAQKMIARGEPVAGGDHITHLRIRDKVTGEKSIDTLAYLLANLDTKEADLYDIWIKNIKNRLTTFLQHVVAPMRNYVTLGTVLASKLETSTLEQEMQNNLQIKMIEELVYRQQGDVESRLLKREHYTRSTQENLARSKFLQPHSVANKTPAMIFPKRLECLSCYSFYDPQIYRLLPTNENRADGKPLKDLICDVSHLDHVYVSAGECLLTVSEEAPMDVEGECTSGDERIDPRADKSFLKKNGNAIYRKVGTTEKSNLCSICLSKADAKKKQIRSDLAEHKTAFFKNRAICYVCMDLAQVPEDPIQPDTPETCSLKTCSIYKEKKSLLTQIELLEHTMLEF